MIDISKYNLYSYFLIYLKKYSLIVTFIKE